MKLDDILKIYLEGKDTSVITDKERNGLSVQRVGKIVNRIRYYENFLYRLLDDETFKDCLKIKFNVDFYLENDVFRYNDNFYFRSNDEVHIISTEDLGSNDYLFNLSTVLPNELYNCLMLAYSLISSTDNNFILFTSTVNWYSKLVQ